LAERRDAAVIAVFRASGIGLSEFAGIRYGPDDPERRGRQCGIEVFPHRFRHHFSHSWLDHGGRRVTYWNSTAEPCPQIPRCYGASACSARARRSCDRVMDDMPCHQVGWARCPGGPARS
jgi:hypothetical protein